MAGWHYRPYGHWFEQALGVGDGQGNLVCYGPWGRKESDMTKQLNCTKLDAEPENSQCVCARYVASVGSDSVRPQGL